MCVCVQACMQHYCNIICVTCVVRHQAGKGQGLAVRASPRCVPLFAPGVHLEWRQRRAKGECDCFPEGIWNKQQGSDFYKTPAVYSATITKYSCWNEDSSSLTKAVITQDLRPACLLWFGIITQVILNPQRICCASNLESKESATNYFPWCAKHSAAVWIIARVICISVFYFIMITVNNKIQS